MEKNSLKKLYKQCLDEKWYLIRKFYFEFEMKTRFLSCPFCQESDVNCHDCKINKKICSRMGKGGLHAKYQKYMKKSFDCINQICNELLIEFMNN